MQQASANGEHPGGKYHKFLAHVHSTFRKLAQNDAHTDSQLSLEFALLFHQGLLRGRVGKCTHSQTGHIFCLPKEGKHA